MGTVVAAVAATCVVDVALAAVENVAVGRVNQTNVVIVVATKRMTKTFTK